MNIIVLGGTGYLGSRMIPKLAAQEHNVIYAKRPEQSIDHLGYAADQRNVIGCDVSSVHKYLAEQNIDWILNFAGMYENKGVSLSAIVDCNTVFGLQMLNLAVENNVKNFLTIDTCLPDHFNIYSFSKKRFADFGRYYSDLYNINFINLLLEMFYGPGEPENRFLPMCIEKLRNNEELPLTAGTQKRDFIHIDDVCQAIITILNSGLKGFQSIPVGTGEGPSVREVVEYLHTILHSSSELKFGQIPMREDEPNSTADLTILHNIGFHCKYDWKTGLGNIILEQE